MKNPIISLFLLPQLFSISANADTNFPAEITCQAKAAYLRRADNQPGREITIDFKGAKVTGDLIAQISIINGPSETLTISSLKDAASATLALPANVGIDKATQATSIQVFTDIAVAFHHMRSHPTARKREINQQNGC